MKKIKMHMVEAPARSAGEQLRELGDYNLAGLADVGVEEAWYWYVTAPWEGWGTMVMRRGDEFDFHNLSHCSCYGPTDRIEFKPKTYDEMVEAIEHGSEYMREDYSTVLAALKKYGKRKSE